MKTLYTSSPGVLNSTHAADADPILGEFFVKFVLLPPFSQACLTYPFRFHNFTGTLNVSATNLYAALLADAEDQPPNWDLQGRQANIWKLLGKKNDSIATRLLYKSKSYRLYSR